jgi:hypothetical protein
MITSYERNNSCETNEGDCYFQDFDDTLSKDSVTNKDEEFVGVDIHMGGAGHLTPVSYVDVVSHSISTNSLLGLDIPINNTKKMHVNKLSLEYSPATMVTFADNHGNAISPMPLIPLESTVVDLPPPTSDIQYNKDEIDDGSTLSLPPCSVTEDTPPSSPNPYSHKSPQKWHNGHPSSLVSCSESCLQSSCSIASYESQIILHYPNPDPLFTDEAGVSPLDSLYSFDEDRSLCADEKAFVQQIHNSGLSSLSFEHVEDNTSMDVEMELVYNSGSFDNGSVDGGSVKSAGSVMSIEERKEMERRIHCYRKFRENRSKMEGQLVSKSKELGVFVPESARSNHAVANVSHGVPATPVASNKALQQFQMPDIDAIDAFNRDCEDSFESLEMTPLAKATHELSGTVNHFHDEQSGRLDLRETKLHPNSNLGWRPYYYTRNFIWWSNKTYDYNHREFDDIDFDRRTSPCRGSCCSRNTRDHSNDTFWYMQTSWSKLLFIACFFLLMGWLFSDDGLQKHQSQKSYYDQVHRTKHGYHLYDRDDPLSKDAFLPRKRIIDDADDFVNPLSRPEDDDIDLSVVERYFPTESQSIADLDDVFKKFELEDDIFDSFTATDETTNGDASNLNDAANAILTGFEDDDDHLSPDIDTLVLLGERHVGLDWLLGKLAVLYPNLDVCSGFPSNKNQIHGEWFQPEEDDIGSASVSKHIIVIALFINPYDW